MSTEPTPETKKENGVMKSLSHEEQNFFIRNYLDEETNNWVERVDEVSGEGHDYWIAVSCYTVSVEVICYWWSHSS